MDDSPDRVLRKVYINADQERTCCDRLSEQMLRVVMLLAAWELMLKVGV